MNSPNKRSDETIYLGYGNVKYLHEYFQMVVLRKHSKLEEITESELNALTEKF